MQRILVTGANRGLGLEFVRQLLERGEHVFSTCRQPNQQLKLTELAGAHPGRLHIFPLDLTSEHSITTLAGEVRALTEALDGLVNNSGVLVSGERFGELSAKTFTDSFATNALGPLLLTQALAPLLAKGHNARVMNLSSELGSLTATSTFHTASYGMSKAALNMATRLLVAPLRAQKTIVVSVHPGWVKTDMGGAGASLTPTESVTGLLKVFDKLKPADSGSFMAHTGAALAW